MGDHAWSSDPGRDAAVRAAEDGRDGPLPTLKEAISRAGKIVSSDGAYDPKCTERDNLTVNGLRTERVVLEIVHDGENGDPADWPFDDVLGGEGWIGDGESVRVVEEELSDAWAQRLASLTAERDAAIRERDALEARVAELEQSIKLCSGSCGFAGRSTQAASGGGEREVANVTFHADDSAERARYVGMTVKPLRRPPPRGWLTGEERGSIQHAATCAKSIWSYSLAQELENILARSTPPEVVLPKLPFTPDSTHAMGWWEAIGKVKRALAAAGVAVNEA